MGTCTEYSCTRLYSSTAAAQSPILPALNSATADGNGNESFSDGSGEPGDTQSSSRPPSMEEEAPDGSPRNRFGAVPSGGAAGPRQTPRSGTKGSAAAARLNNNNGRQKRASGNAAELAKDVGHFPLPPEEPVRRPRPPVSLRAPRKSSDSNGFPSPRGEQHPQQSQHPQHHLTSPSGLAQQQQHHQQRLPVEPPLHGREGSGHSPFALRFGPAPVQSRTASLHSGGSDGLSSSGDANDGAWQPQHHRLKRK